MASAWGSAWGNAWGSAWGSITATPTTSVDAGSGFADYSPTNDSLETVKDNRLICDRSGFLISTKQGLHTEWNGKMVRVKDFEYRHPQDLVRPTSPRERQGSRSPEPTDEFLSTTEVDPDDL